ncbi:MAG: glycolate oxidase subunit GlcF [Proteobacteria bacterium]|nr:glycolate oxidase subunit GlcF [Pseudomonadota bacterium]MBI3498643.1 glycolate oxidase subunit GlcF [Pseudomonadota bacterium]
MQTDFTLAQLADPDIAEANKILRACVHCGFCTATCPTYLLLGDELDSPRGRIYLIKDMLEGDKPASPRLVRHIDRCLSCLACMTTCPSSVNYMHLVDQARRRIEETFRRPPLDRWLRSLLAFLLPHPMRFRLALVGAGLLKPIGRHLPGRLGAMFTLAPSRLPGPSSVDRPQIFPAGGVRKKRVALLTGCAQQVLAPEINEATIRLLTRHGCEVVVAQGAGCCGALVHHMGREEAALAAAKANIAAWWRVHEQGGLDAIVINASGCGTVVKDYGYMLRTDAAWADRAKFVSALARDVSELMTELGLEAPRRPIGLRVAYHAACSLQHGQKIHKEPRALLEAAGCHVVEVPEGHICCGSAGTYNLLQPELARSLGRRKAANIAKTGADVVAAGNIGCITQIAEATALPVLHTVELLDWATGGPMPARLG